MLHPDTLISMWNGSQLPISRISAGDVIRGGRVIAVTRAVSQDFYWYNGVIVTGDHAVKENGRWVRLENAKLGHHIPRLIEVVCNLVTESHRIYANGIEFTDQHETDAHEILNPNESLQELNKNTREQQTWD